MRIVVALLLVPAAGSAAQLPQPRVALEAITVAPQALAGGGAVTLSIRLVGPAPNPGGQRVALRYSSPDVLESPPTFVQVPGGRNRAAIDLVTRPTATQVAVTVSTGPSPAPAAVFVVRPPRVASIRFSKPALPGGDSTTMTVLFDGPTPGTANLEIEPGWPGLLFYSAPTQCVVNPCPWGSQLTSLVAVPAGVAQHRLRLYVDLGGPPTPSITARLYNGPAVAKSLQVLRPRPSTIIVASECPAVAAAPPLPGASTPPRVGPTVVVRAADRTTGLGESVALAASDPAVVLPASASYSATVYGAQATPSNPMPVVFQHGRACAAVTFPKRDTAATYRISATSGGLSVSQAVTIPPNH
ncbi:MAG: hypothetical protein ACKVZ0_19815 [Gemmatimonadales bacterium]